MRCVIRITPLAALPRFFITRIRGCRPLLSPRARINAIYVCLCYAMLLRRRQSMLSHAYDARYMRPEYRCHAPLFATFRRHFAASLRSRLHFMIAAAIAA